MKKITLLLCGFLALPVFAQKEKTVEGEFVYHVPETQSLADAKKHTLNMAKFNALASEFGTIISQTNLTHIQNSNSQTVTQFNSFGSSDVKGEWIETIGKVEYKVKYEDESLIVSCKVKGKAREIETSQIDFQAKVLRNGTDDRNEDDRFAVGDNFFLSFKTPIKGFVAIYLVEESKSVQCLLPYQKQQDGIYQVEANYRYVFFSQKDAQNQEKVDEMFFPEGSLTNYQVYVIFSPNQFVKAVDSASNKDLSDRKTIYPRELSFNDFHKWLAKCRRRDKEMCLQKILLTVGE
jgi:hypothetical protein